MPIFKSLQPDIDLPRNVTTWEWFFESPSSPLSRLPPSKIRGFTDAITKQRISYADLKIHATHLSTALVRNHGLRQGDTVALFSQNTIWYPVALHGVARVGGIVSGASPAYTVDEMVHALKVGKARFLMTVPGSMNVAATAAKAVGIPRERVFLLEGELQGFTTMRELLRQGEEYGMEEQVEPFRIPRGMTNFDFCGFLSFSSGTTGLPKAVMIAHQNIIAQSIQIINITPPLSPHQDFRKVLAALPSFHITGLIHILQLPIMLNAEVYMIPTFTMEAMLDTVTTYKIPELLLVPPIIIRLVRDPVVAKYDLRCIERFSSGAAPLSEEILVQLQQKFPGTGFRQGYGMTESASCITAHTPDMYDFKFAHSVGKICASTEVKIIDSDGKECGIDEPGEILARGPQVVMGYLGNAEATRETFDADGFLHTGDQGKIDRDGIVYITDRIKEMIKVKGIGVAPAELEDLLLGHPEVEDCAVCAIPDDYSGEKPKGYVVKKGARDDIELGQQLLQYVKEKKVRHKWIKEIEFMETIPKSPSGKILRRVLRDMEKDATIARGTIVRDKSTLQAKL